MEKGRKFWILQINRKHSHGHFKPSLGCFGWKMKVQRNAKVKKRENRDRLEPPPPLRRISKSDCITPPKKMVFLRAVYMFAWKVVNHSFIYLKMQIFWFFDANILMSFMTSPSSTIPKITGGGSLSHSPEWLRHCSGTFCHCSSRIKRLMKSCCYVSYCINHSKWGHNVT